MKKTLRSEVRAQLATIAQKRLQGETITTAEAMVMEYGRPCITAMEKSADAHGFGAGTLIVTRDKICIVCGADAGGELEFYPPAGLIRSAILEGSRYPDILAGSRLVRGRYYIQVCIPRRLAQEKSLARIINKWLGWIAKTAKSSG